MQIQDAIGALNVLAQNIAEAMTDVLIWVLVLITVGKANVAQHVTIQMADGLIMFVIIIVQVIRYTQEQMLRIIAWTTAHLQQIRAAQERQCHAA